MKAVHTSSVCLVWLVLSNIFLFNGQIVAHAQRLPASATTEALVTVSASIGEPVLRLWGYGPPGSRIELSGDRVSDFTYSETDGYFEFKKTFLPAPTDLLYPELCLSGIDQIGRATPPTCIPPLPANEFSYDIGPVILPPTLSLTEGSVAPFSQAEANGITIPNSVVRIALAENKGGQNLTNFSIVKEALAYYIPNYTVKSDERGYFNFNMPDTYPNTWRVFAITNYSQGATSPKSNTLKFEVVSPTLITIGKIWAFILSLLTLPALIIIEVLIILLIIAVTFLTKNGKKKVSLNIVDPIKEYQSQLKSKYLP
jgi:hypothetical protein